MQLGRDVRRQASVKLRESLREVREKNRGSQQQASCRQESYLIASSSSCFPLSPSLIHSVMIFYHPSCAEGGEES